MSGVRERRFTGSELIILIIADSNVTVSTSISISGPKFGFEITGYASFTGMFLWNCMHSDSFVRWFCVQLFNSIQSLPFFFVPFPWFSVFPLSLIIFFLFPSFFLLDNGQTLPPYSPLPPCPVLNPVCIPERRNCPQSQAPCPPEPGRRLVDG